MPSARADVAQAVEWQLSKTRGLRGSIQAAALARMRSKGTAVSDMSCTLIQRVVHVQDFRNKRKRAPFTIHAEASELATRLPHCVLTGKC